MSAREQYERFAALHVPGDPACCTTSGTWAAPGRWPRQAPRRWRREAIRWPTRPALPMARGVPIDFALANAKRIAEAVELPLTVDFEGAYSTDPAVGAANVVRLAETGAVGCNFEDQVFGADHVHPFDLQCRRIAAIRSAVGDAFFINARTDLFLKVKEHDESLVEHVIERGKAFADCGASGFFVPRLADPRQVDQIVRAVPLPLNLIAFPGAPPKAEWAAAGAARISHGPFPHRALMKQLEEAARTAMS